MKTPSETASVVGETVVAPKGMAGGEPESTFIMAAGPYTGLLAPPEAEGELGRLGDYAVLRELGRGGMGLVFEAEDPRLKRRVALKVMLPDFAKQPEAKERFLREARSAAAVEHDHVVPVYQVGEDRGVPYLAMRLLPGESLADLLARKGSLPPASVAGLGRQAALGLAAAHERGLIHRDIKPGNLWVEPGGRVRVLDFGLARPQEATGELTRSGAVVGTPEYLAPEQLRAEDLDGRADLFSLGAVLYRAATGVSPFRRDTLYGTLRAVEADAPPDPRTHRADLPAPLAELILKLLAKDRNQRPASAAAAAKAFKDLGPVLTKPGQVQPDALVSPGPSAAAPAANTAAAVATPPAASAATAFPVFEPPPVLPSGLTAKKPAPKPKPKVESAKGGGPPWKNRKVQLAAGGGFLGLLGVIFALTLSVGDATLTIEGLDPDMQVLVERGGEAVKFLDAKTGASAELDPGTYELTLRGGAGEGLNAHLTETTITLSRGDEKVVVVEIEKPGSPEAATGGQGGEPSEGEFALEFDGKSSYVRIPSLRLPDGPLTVEAWIQPRAVSERSVIAVAGGSSHGNLHWNRDDRGFLYAAGARRSVLRTPHGLPANRGPYHVAGVWDGTKLMFFFDGRPASGTPSWPYSDLPDSQSVESLIGARDADRGAAVATDQYFDGVIDEVRFSRTARYSGEFTPRRRFEPDGDTLALYHFGEGSGTVAKDASGNGHDGAIVGAKWVGEAGSASASARWQPMISGQALDGEAVPVDGVRLESDGLRLDIDAEFASYLSHVKSRDSVVRGVVDFRSGQAVKLLSRKQTNSDRYMFTVYRGGQLQIGKGRGGEVIASGRLDVPPAWPAAIAFAAVGDRLTGYVNGKPVISARDEAYGSGKSGVAAGGPDGADCLFRDLEICVLDGAGLTPEQALGIAEGEPSAREGFADLFAGSSLAGWSAFRIPGNAPGSSSDWTVRGGVVECATRNPGWLRYDKQLGDFELDLEFLVPSGGNSGVLIRHSGQDPLPQHGMEVQIIDSDPGKFGPTQVTGAIYGAVPAAPADAMLRGKWNRMKVRCHGERVQVVLNGINVVDAKTDGVPALQGRPRSGYIGLYSHDGSGVGTKFRNVRLRESAPAAAAATPDSGPAAEAWTSLFDGRTLGGWREVGAASFEVVDGAIVGSSVANASNSYLCTTKDYGDFELEFEVKVLRDDFNSGVQIRSHSRPDYKSGMVHGPQIEIEWSPGRSGYVYGEGTTGRWISPQAMPGTTSAFKNGDWNQFRVTATGPTIEAWVNGRHIIKTTHATDTNPNAPGFIALQVHSYKGPHPAQVMWRNIRVREI